MVKGIKVKGKHYISFKPYYKWIIFNIETLLAQQPVTIIGFKPYYKWIIFNITKKNLKSS
mgnify:CR=1 FL=1